MKFTSDTFVLIIFVLGMIYIFCNQNIEGICTGGKGCRGDDPNKCNPIYCTWVDADSPEEGCHVTAMNNAGGGHPIISGSTAVHATGCNPGRDTCLHEDCEQSIKGCRIGSDPETRDQFPCMVGGVVSNECYCVPQLYPCAQDHATCNGHGTGGHDMDGCSCTDGYTGTCCTVAPTPPEENCPDIAATCSQSKDALLEQRSPLPAGICDLNVLRKEDGTLSTPRNICCSTFGCENQH
jgi:hypothetical protein